MILSEGQSEVMDRSGHQLITGGPGSGKTTISILKAAQVVNSDLPAGGRVLFLSFARATIARVVEAIEFEQRIPREQKRRIDVETYHSFFWRVIRAHGYLIGLPRRLSILTPPNEAIALSSLRNGYPPDSKLSDEERAEKAAKETEERRRAAFGEGLVCFDLFAPVVAKIVESSVRVRDLLSTMYPLIILDEFQDTNSEQWHVVRALGERSTLIALADPQQRIFDFIGADPERLSHFTDSFAPSSVDLSSDNHRSPGTDIADFGDDVLNGRFRSGPYSGIDIVQYDANASQAWTALVTTTYAARKRLVEAVNGDAAVLAAEVIATLMQPFMGDGDFFDFVAALADYFQGRGGDQPTKKDLNEAARLAAASSDLAARQRAGKPPKKNSVLVRTLDVYAGIRRIPQTGDPDTDWLSIRNALDVGSCPRLQQVGRDARLVRLLERGMQLRQDLSQDWRDHGGYTNALQIVRRAFVQAHLTAGTRPESGVVILNMHKGKGKQFDEVIIFDGWPRIARRKIVANPDRIVRGNAVENCDGQTRNNLRVSITRGRHRTTILTPAADRCLLLPPST
ncbi:MAG: AAA family ATPase [Deltaproteobacteria bacterium]|nr:AAA family ATPase [Deltaproteobacteria bacterium]